MPASIPRHVAIIMDGNGRWAQQRGKIRTEGHLEGAKSITRMLEAAGNAGVEYITVYAFSTENWKRPPAEVSFLMNLIPKFCKDKMPDLMKNGIRLGVIGRIDGLPKAAQEAIRGACEKTANNNKLTFTIALNYGGRAEIIDAVNAILADKSRPAGQKVTEEEFRNYLYAPDLPDPDLLIRTGGEMRISNFLLWELSYAELYVTDVLWPDFDEAEFQKALAAFGSRQRRFGEVKP